MTDEKYTFIEDVREKKRTATGAHHKRTHCGKGGAIRFPSDFMTKKERNAMNGEVKSYKLNDPMSWEEFKAMPDDIKRTYITALRKKYNVSDTKIAKMLGVSREHFCVETKRLGIGLGKHCKRGKFDNDGWSAWVNGVPVAANEEAEEVSVMEKCDEEVPESAEKCEKAEGGAASGFVFRFDKDGVTVAKEVKPAIPGWGQMELEGSVEECTNTLKHLLADRRVKLAVSRTVVE